MKKQAKIIYIIFLAAFTAATGIILFRTGYKTQITKLARERLEEDIISLNFDISRMESEKKSALEEIDSLNESISEQSFLNDQIAENRKLYMELTKNIDEENKLNSQLDDEISAKKEAIKKLESISVKEGTKKEVLDPRNTYTCPKDFEPGFYKASGYGTLLVYGTTNRLRISENLGAIDTNSFVFNLEENERIKIDEETEIVRIE